METCALCLGDSPFNCCLAWPPRQFVAEADAARQAQAYGYARGLDFLARERAVAYLETALARGPLVYRWPMFRFEAARGVRQVSIVQAVNL